MRLTRKMQGDIWISRQPEYQERRFLLSELAERFPKKDLDQLSREEVIKICDQAMADAEIPAVFENAFAMDYETLRKLQEDASKQYGEGFYCAPGSEYIEGSDPWNGTWNVKQWTKEQEAYYVVYKQQLDEKRFYSPTLSVDRVVCQCGWSDFLCTIVACQRLIFHRPKRKNRKSFRHRRHIRWEQPFCRNRN